MRVIVLGYHKRPGVLEAVEALRPGIEEQAEIVWEDLSGQALVPELESEVDVAIVFGGDGSILHAVRQLGGQRIPIMAVNLGRLGFLASIHRSVFLGCLTTLREFILLRGPDWSEAILEQDHRGIPRLSLSHFTIAQHALLECTVRESSRPDAPILASSRVINEVAIQSSSFRILELQLFADEEFVTTYSCDSLILSTPIGSTAHNLSAGGPILRQGMDVVVISPIAPHTLSCRPVVDSAQRSYRMNILSANQEATVIVDGQILTSIVPGNSVQIRPSDTHFRMLYVPGYSYYNTLQQKLGWGGQPHYNS